MRRQCGSCAAMRECRSMGEIMSSECAAARRIYCARRGLQTKSSPAMPDKRWRMQQSRRVHTNGRRRGAKERAPRTRRYRDGCGRRLRAGPWAIFPRHAARRRPTARPTFSPCATGRRRDLAGSRAARRRRGRDADGEASHEAVTFDFRVPARPEQAPVVFRCRPIRRPAPRRRHCAWSRPTHERG